MQRLFILPLVLVTFLFVASPVSSQHAENNLVSFEYPTYKQPPGTGYLVSVSVFLDPKDVVRTQVITDKPFLPLGCKNCPITIKLENPQESDSIIQSNTKTDQNGIVSAKIISYIYGKRTMYAEVVMPDGSTYMSGKYTLNYFEATEMESTGTLSRPIPVVTATIKKRLEPSQVLIFVTSYPPNPTSSAPIKIKITEYPVPHVTAMPPQPNPEVDNLNKKMNDLQKQLEESKQKQAVLEKTVNNLISWIRTHVPFFR